jgi:hypothetical protein
MTIRKASLRKFASGVGIALITLTHTTASATADAIPAPGSVRFVDHGGPVLHTALAVRHPPWIRRHFRQRHRR